MLLVGTHELVIDNKGRVSVPFAIRGKLNPDTDGRSFYVLPGKRQGTLAIYPDKYFEKLTEHAAPAGPISDETYEWRQFEGSQTVLLDPDAQGRILIPERLLKRAGIAREAVLIGVQDHMELWNPHEFAAFEEAKWPDYHSQRAKAAKELYERGASQLPPAAPQRVPSNQAQ